MAKGLRILLLLHGIITIAAGIILVLFPAAIPSTVNIKLQPSQFLLSYFLGAAEISLGCLSLSSRKLKDGVALKEIIKCFIIFHATTAILEGYVLAQEINSSIIFNIFLRIIIVLLFLYYGIVRKRS